MRTSAQRGSRLTYANVTSTLALVIAVGGGGAIAHATVTKNSVRSPHIKNGQVKTVDLGARAVTGPKVRRGALNSTHIKDNSLRAADLTDDPIGVARGYVWNYRDASPLNEASPLEGSYRYNSSGGATSVTRSAVGIYQVQFEGLTLDAGTVHVTAYGSNAAACKMVSWGGEDINVRCFDAAGNPANSLFTVAYLE